MLARSLLASMLLTFINTAPHCLLILLTRGGQKQNKSVNEKKQKLSFYSPHILNIFAQARKKSLNIFSADQME